MEKTICELFAGVGGFRLGFDRLNSNWKTVWFSQWEPNSKHQYAYDCYVNHFGNSYDLNGEIHTNENIETVDKFTIPDHLLLVGGFPCQDYSVANKSSQGIEGKKGVLWWQIYEILKVKSPKYCIFENVDRLLKSPSKQRGRDFGIMLSCFAEQNYSVEWRIVNAADYGASQRRRRLFIFAYKNDSEYGKVVGNELDSNTLLRKGFMAKAFPIEDVGDIEQFKLNKDIKEISDKFSFEFKPSGYMCDYNVFTTKVKEEKIPFVPLKYILETDVEDKFYVDETKLEKWKYAKCHKRILRKTKEGHEYVFTEGSMAFPDDLNLPSRTIITQESTLNRTSHIIMDPNENKYRVLTPIETERLNGFEDNWTLGMPKRMRYFCMGNALVVPMITRMGKVLDDIIDKKCFNIDEKTYSNKTRLW